VSAVYGGQSGSFCISHEATPSLGRIDFIDCKCNVYAEGEALYLAPPRAAANLIALGLLAMCVL
jgi:hypothetical protein